MANKDIPSHDPWPVSSPLAQGMALLYDPTTDKEYRANAGDLPGGAGAVPGNNDRPDLWKAARWYSTGTPGYDGAGPVLLGLLASHPERFCYQTRVLVEFNPDGSRNQTYRFIYDAASALEVPREFGAGAPLLPVRLVLESSPEARLASIPLFKNTTPVYYKADTTATPPVAGDFVQHVVSGDTQATVHTPKRNLVATAFPGGVIPAPTGLPGDVNWLKLGSAPPVTPAQPTRIVVTQADAVYYAGAGLLTTDLPVLITDRRKNGVDLPNVLVNGSVDNFRLSASAQLVPATGPVEDGRYTLATDDFSPIDYTLLAAVRVTFPGAGAKGYPDLASAVAGTLADFGGLDECTFLLNSAQVVSSNIQLDNAAALVGQQVAIIVESGATLRLPTSETQGVYISGGGGTGTVVLQGTIRNSRVISSEQVVLTTCTVYNSALSINTVAAGATLTVGAATTLPAGFFAGMTDNGDGSYSTPDGGTVVDQRGGSASGATLDLLALTPAQLDEVMALTFGTDGEATDATPAWSRPGHEFDAKYPSGDAYHFYCRRGTYVPGDATSGAGPRWHRIFKQQA
ncbi:hypothetical protein LJ737_04195 [Hymenobacter sp. 15J16-1T3B]|uniref:hypothetical protein n=1 Tax=Hymenobacter sp. 15J16-1T3B TaxID=2886941 RepID=UPI001D118440|nr:hypothetical protein [Hymenobacter sp. 15J16-1T3B]MCC3156423.1 hypothetical protein [Hymenobacter sp. 15J16-1T3B]